MSDYIRKDDVLALLEKYRIELPSTYSAGLTTAKNAVKGMPTEDVVPRTEVARGIFAEIEKVFFKYADEFSSVGECKLLEPIRQAVLFASNELFVCVEEIKKKYGVTEE